MSDTKAFIIHLERAAQRRPQVERLRDALPCASEVFSATDGVLLAQEEVDRVYRRGLKRPLYPFALSRGEIGVFLSHRALWRRIAAEGLDYALIFEDDAAIEAEQFAKTFALARETRALWTYALAPSEKTPVGGKILAQGEGVALLRPDNPPLRAIAQFVSGQAARRLLEIIAQFDRPVDTFLQMSWVTGVELLAFKPSGVRDASAGLGGSTIQARKKPLSQKLARETLRPLYRAQVRLWRAFARKPEF